MASESTSDTLRFNPTSAVTERESRCSPGSEKVNGTEISQSTEQISPLHSDATNAEDVSNQSEIHVVNKCLISTEEDAPSPDTESETQRSPDTRIIDSTPAVPESEAERNINIIILGKTGAGKATIGNRIVGHPIFAVSTSIGGITRTATARTALHCRNGISYKIKLIDTVGVRDTEPRYKFILDEIEDFVDSTDGIHLIIFVFKNSRFTQEDERAFSFITERFKTVIEMISLLIITRCEMLKRDAREELVAEVKNQEPTKDIARSMKKGIVTVGFPNLKSVTVQLQPIYEVSVKEDSKTLQLITENCNQSVSPDEFQKCIQTKCSCVLL